MITLHTMPGTSELESLSPFCMKVEVYLEVQGIPYRTKVADPRAAPKRKLPFIVDGPTTIADSSSIIDHLESRSDHPLDHGLDAAARARSHVLKRTFEESLYWPLLWSRWGDDDGWLELGPHIAAVVPAAVRWFVPGLIRRKIVASTVAQGIGRHSRDEIFAIGAADIAAVATLLGDADYLIDDRLRTIDVTAYAFLANILLWPRPSPLTAAARALPALDAYVKRVGARVKAGAAK
ncbi:MAG TPA: glutathione S-transferase family protein [Labilithrix sp.]|nr:glutathione S-transferase family protein [Labilithrix sp.]